MYEHLLARATHNLPPTPKIWISRALRSGWFNIEPGDYDGRPHLGVCPVVAGAILAGAWADGHPKPGYPDWGPEDGPRPEVEEFAAYFDLCADELGTDEALRIIQDELSKDRAPAEPESSDRLAS